VKFSKIPTFQHENGQYPDFSGYQSDLVTDLKLRKRHVLKLEWGLDHQADAKFRSISETLISIRDHDVGYALYLK